MTAPAIPRRLGHIWVGDRPAPVQWMDSWRAAHPDWDYTLYDNAYLTGRRWRNQRLIESFFRRGHYEGVSDLMRYELLYEQGGFLPEADSTCLHPCDGLFTEPCTFTCYDQFPKKRSRLTPFLASAPETYTLALVLDDLHGRYAGAPDTARQPWISVGNLYLRGFLQTYRDEITDLRIWPAYFFVPQFKDGPRYDGPGQIYADQHWASTLDRYQANPPDIAQAIREDVLTRLSATDAMALTDMPPEEPAPC